MPGTVRGWPRGAPAAPLPVSRARAGLRGGWPRRCVRLRMWLHPCVTLALRVHVRQQVRKACVCAGHQPHLLGAAPAQEGFAARRAPPRACTARPTPAWRAGSAAWGRFSTGSSRARRSARWVTSLVRPRSPPGRFWPAARVVCCAAALVCTDAEARMGPGAAARSVRDTPCAERRAGRGGAEFKMEDEPERRVPSRAPPRWPPPAVQAES